MSDLSIKGKPVDDAAVAKADAVLVAHDIKVDAKILRQALEAATEEAPEPKPHVSLAMIDAGRNVWLNNPTASPHVLLPIIYRAMDAVKVFAAVKTVDAAADDQIASGK